MDAGSGVAVGLIVTIFGVAGLTVGETVIWVVGWTVAWAEAFFFFWWCLTVEAGVVDAVGALTAAVGVVDAFCALTTETPAKIRKAPTKLKVLFIIPLLKKLLRPKFQKKLNSSIQA